MQQSLVVFHTDLNSSSIVLQNVRKIPGVISAANILVEKAARHASIASTERDWAIGVWLHDTADVERMRMLIQSMPGVQAVHRQRA